MFDKSLTWFFGWMAHVFLLGGSWVYFSDGAHAATPAFAMAAAFAGVAAARPHM